MDPEQTSENFKKKKVITKSFHILNLFLFLRTLLGPNSVLSTSMATLARPRIKLAIATSNFNYNQIYCTNVQEV